LYDKNAKNFNEIRYFSLFSLSFGRIPASLKAMIKVECVGGPLDGEIEVHPLQNVAFLYDPAWGSGYYRGNPYDGKLYWRATIHEKTTDRERAMSKKEPN
jgi:hypothetical protein